MSQRVEFADASKNLVLLRDNAAVIAFLENKQIKISYHPSSSSDAAMQLLFLLTASNNNEEEPLRSSKRYHEKTRNVLVVDE